MKDWVKIADAREKKNLDDIKKKLLEMQKNNEFPAKFMFPLMLQFELTSQCNVRCKHCYNNSGIYNDRRDRMSSEDWINFVKYLVDRGGIFEAILSGGEPLLLGDKLFDIMDILHNDGTHFLLITNGFLLNDEIVNRLEKYYYKWIQVSIDGCSEEYHDMFRNRDGSWKRAVSGAIKIANAGLPLTIAHSVTKENLADIDNMCELAYNIGAGTIILGEVNISGRAYDNKDLILNRDERNYLYEKTEENLVKYNGKMQVRHSGTVKNQLMRYQAFPVSGAIIRPNGDIRLDCMTPFVIGNILDSDFEEVWKNKSQNCWHNPEVEKYISSYDDEGISNMYIKNYIDKDYVL